MNLSEDNQEQIPPLLEPPKRNFTSIMLGLFIVGALVILGLLIVTSFINKPVTLSGTQTVLVSEGQTVPEITRQLKEAGVVRSEFFLYLVLVTQFDSTAIKASRYIFEQPLTTYQVAERLIAGDFDTDLLSVTVFEGESRKKIADRFVGKFNWYDKEEFLALTEGFEGRLFPDTYFIPNDYSTEKFVELLKGAHNDVIQSYEEEIRNNPLSEEEIINLASIVEREANSPESMKLVAGIFLNRMSIDMALQADATIEYVMDEGLHELPPGALAESLREIDSPYNTYKYRGLPPTPISNPGRDAIEAVLFPTESEYLYYITGNDGVFYFAETHYEHVRNINRHLR